MNKQYAFYFDQSRCMACNACSVTCKDWNQLNPGLVSWRKQHTHEVDGHFFPLSMACNHCAKPACMEECPFDAISKQDNGIVLIDRNKCQSCGTCLETCPYGASQIADSRQEPVKKESWDMAHPAQKCNMCFEKVEKGEKPTCVLSCVGRAMDFGTVEEILAKYPEAVRMNKKDFPYAYVNDDAGDSTEPSFFVKKRKTLNIHRSTKYTGKPVA